MAFGTSNSAIMREMQTNQDSTFKTVNNLLTLQENHVEEFFEYHGNSFLPAFEKLIEDVVERVVSQMLGKLEFVHDSTSGHIKVQADCLREFDRITQENIDLDIQTLLATAINSEVVMQRKMAKAQYLESQGFGTAQMQSTQMNANPAEMGMNPAQIQGNPQTGGMNQQMMMQQNAMNNQSGYPIPPSGYDTYNNPYWTDPQTGQMTYTPPNSGLGLASKAAKVAAWAKWLA